MNTVQTINTEAALATLSPVNDKLTTALFLARKSGILRNPEFAIPQLHSAAGELFEITKRTLQREPEAERVSRKLMVVAGMFSDIQEYYHIYEERNLGEFDDLLNSIKSDIFDTIDIVDPRQ